MRARIALAFAMIAALIAALVATASCTTLPGYEAPEGSLPEMERIRVRELFREFDVAGEALWPGFVKSTHRFILVGPRFQWEFNGGTLPAGYQRLPVPDDLSANVKSLAFAPNSAPAAGASENGSIFVVDSVPNSARLGTRITSETWLREMYRGLFREFQLHSLPPGRPVAARPENLEKIQRDSVHRSLVKFELNRLASGACGDPGVAVAALGDVWRLRTRRWNYLAKAFGAGPAYRQWEQYEAAIEGTEHYVEYQMMSFLPKFKEDALFEDDEYFQGFESFKNLSRESWCEQIGDPPDDQYWLYLGWGYALALDRAKPDWKSKIWSSPDFFDSQIADVAGPVR